MSTIKVFTFNAFQENTYVIASTNNECAIIDPGCSNVSEQNQLVNYIEENDLTPTLLLNTHCHIDHILGNQFIAKKYNLQLQAHTLEIPVLASGTTVSQMYGVPYIPSPSIEIFIAEGDEIVFDDVTFTLIHAPGHSPGSICFYNKNEKYIIAGDVLFYGSIGRTDLPLGNNGNLISSIKNKLFKLDADVTVYAGHGQKTNIGFEKLNNPYLKG